MQEGVLFLAKKNVLLSSILFLTQKRLFLLVRGCLEQVEFIGSIWLESKPGLIRSKDYLDERLCRAAFIVVSFDPHHPGSDHVKQAFQHPFPKLNRTISRSLSLTTLSLFISVVNPVLILPKSNRTRSRSASFTQPSPFTSPWLGVRIR